VGIHAFIRRGQLSKTRHGEKGSEWKARRKPLQRGGRAIRKFMGVLESERGSPVSYCYSESRGNGEALRGEREFGPLD